MTECQGQYQVAENLVRRHVKLTIAGNHQVKQSAECSESYAVANVPIPTASMQWPASKWGDKDAADDDNQGSQIGFTMIVAG